MSRPATCRVSIGGEQFFFAAKLVNGIEIRRLTSDSIFYLGAFTCYVYPSANRTLLLQEHTGHLGAQLEETHVYPDCFSSSQSLYSSSLFFPFVRHFECCTLVPRLPSLVPRSPFPVPRSIFFVFRFPFPVSRSPFPVPRSRY